MSATTVSAALRRTVVERAQHCCEYCGTFEDAVLVPHEPDHIIGEQHGGVTSLVNLAQACFRCNRYKGPNIATRDPLTGHLVPLFNPRTEQWSDHFQLDGASSEEARNHGSYVSCSRTTAPSTRRRGFNSDTCPRGVSRSLPCIRPSCSQAYPSNRSSIALLRARRRRRPTGAGGQTSIGCARA